MPADPPDLTARTPDPDVTTRRGDSLPPLAITPPAGGRYVLGAEIARGGMGAVYRATDTALGREVAVKLLQEQFGPDSGTARRFADEAHIAGQLQHPGIPPVHDFGTLPDGRPFLAMKLIKGDTLDQLLRTRRDPGDDRGRFVAVFEAVCQAVGYAHAHDVIHRDLKPANVMVGAFGEVQVMDWGLAKVLRPGGAADGTVADAGATAPNTEVRSLRGSDGHHTQAGAVMGTPAYMPPEQAAGAAHKVTPRSDVFGLGAVMAVILTGRPPFEAGSAETTRVKAAQGDVADCLSRLDACGAEPELVALCKRCLSPRPADRPANAGEVAAAVADFRAQAEARARQAELDRVKAEGERATAEAKAEAEAITRREAEARAAEQRKRRRVQVWLAAAAVLLVAGAGGVAVWRVDEEGKKRTEAARLEGEEGERKSRAADAVGDLLDRTKAVLEAGDAARAAPLLDQADRRAADDAVAEHADRRAAYARDLAMLRTLDGVNDFRWTVLDSKTLPLPERVVERWAAAFAGYGIVPGTTPPAEAAARINASPIRTALLAGLDGWLARSRSAAVRDLLSTADPDPFRDDVRQRMAAGDVAGLSALVGRHEWAAQPSGLVLAYSGSPAMPTAPARQLLLRFAVARRTDFALLMQLGDTYLIKTSDKAGERVRWYQAAAALQPENATALYNLGNVLLDRKDLDGAAAAYREAIRLDPKYALPHNNLGIVLYERKDLDGAAAAYREAIRLDPKHARPHNNLGIVLYKRKDLDGAAAAYREAIRLDPKYALPHYGLGNVLFDRKDLDGAAAAYREAARLDPNLTPPPLGLGNVLRDRKDLDGAAAAYREAIRLVPVFAVPHKGLGIVIRDRKDLDGAAAALREAIRLDPKHANWHNHLGMVLRAKGELDGAAAAYREAIRLDPKYALPHHGLGTLLRDRKDLDGAAAALREAIHLDPALAQPHHSLGTVLQAKGDLDGAAAAFREAARLNPKDAVAVNNLGDVLERQGDLTGAEERYREALRIDPKYAVAFVGVGDVRRKWGRYDEAIAAYRAALGVQPTLGSAREGLDYCLRVQRGEVPTAPPPRAVTR
ncbi:tetratricopeptide repeat protein [Urbifossiella limnaea]|uniref:Serine/threonine-protein kinase PknB n=1 Tax=Urbifossiella limnaea TaxID=2528023 RepID=A0A517Y1H0_9BACT|nr:tetratricopeptide repeat protein [Urbifossiella limnaea]QDU23616.1 Serine/threonine-protein kinase PknB [Urbifossiella limnaea]